MMHLVDTVEVEPGHVEDYLDVLRSLGRAVMTDAGATFVSCATTSSEIGERVHVQVVWAVDDHGHWDEIRKNLVLDPAITTTAPGWPRCGRAGTRRFFTDVDLPAPP